MLCLFSFLSIFILEKYLYINVKLDDTSVNYTIDKIVKCSLAFLPLLLLPEYIKRVNFDSKHLYLIILVFILTSITFNISFFIKNGLDRDTIAEKLNPIILYDYISIALTFILLPYAVNLKKYSYPLIFLCLTNMLLIILHGSRGSWFGIPLCFLILFFTFYKTYTRKILTIFITPIIGFLGLIFLPNSSIWLRIQKIFQDSQEVSQQNYHSSIGTRIKIWEETWLLFQKNPLYGVGYKNIVNETCLLAKNGILPGCFAHAHNTYLEEITAHGLLGIGLLLSIFILPTIFFIKNYNIQKHNSIHLSGLLFISYLICCAFTDYIFINIGYSVFTLLTLTILISLSYIAVYNSKSNH